MEDIPSFIKIGGAVSEKKGRNGQTFVVLYIGYNQTKFLQFTLHSNFSRVKWT